MSSGRRCQAGPIVADVRNTAATDEQPSRATIEREAKLVAPAGVRLPDLTDLVPGTTIATLPERDLDATYYDTADLRLARAGITVRHRSGEPGPPWTVKLPQGGRGPALARREIGFVGPPDRMPDAASDLVLGSTRGAPLAAVARLATVRLPTEIRDGGGCLLAEVVDDTVAVSRGQRPVERFREIEVELGTAVPDGSALLRAAVARLIEAGCVAQPPVPKLVRALGKKATRPPDVVVRPLAADSTVTDLVSHAIARSVTQLVRHDPGVRLGDDPEDVHQLRVATRRLRSDLRTFAGLLDRDRVRALRDELGWLATLAGAVRDTDVLTARLRANCRTLSDADGPAVAGLLRRLDAEAGTARAAMLGGMRTSRYLELLGSLVAVAVEPPLADRIGAADRALIRVAADVARRPWRRLAAAVSALDTAPSDAALHEIRILAKRCRYAAEAVAPVVGRPATRFADAIADLQTVLGDHQDTVVAEDWLRSAAAADPATGIAAGQLIAVEGGQRARLRTQWPATWRTASDKSLRTWL